jgi:hypothetical protein
MPVTEHSGGRDWDHLCQPRHKVRKTLSQPISQVLWYMPLIPVVQEAIGRRIMVRLVLLKNMGPYLKNN